jgi:hypothetical protein
VNGVGRVGAKGFRRPSPTTFTNTIDAMALHRRLFPDPSRPVGSEPSSPSTSPFNRTLPFGARNPKLSGPEEINAPLDLFFKGMEDKIPGYLQRVTGGTHPVPPPYSSPRVPITNTSPRPPITITEPEPWTWPPPKIPFPPTYLAPPTYNPQTGLMNKREWARPPHTPYPYTSPPPYTTSRQRSPPQQQQQQPQQNQHYPSPPQRQNPFRSFPPRARDPDPIPLNTVPRWMRNGSEQIEEDQVRSGMGFFLLLVTALCFIYWGYARS